MLFTLRRRIHYKSAVQFLIFVLIIFVLVREWSDSLQPHLTKSNNVDSIEPEYTFRQQFLDRSLSISFTRLPSLPCSPPLPLLVFVISTPHKLSIRDAIRNSWASANQSEAIANGKAKVLFVLGSGLLRYKEIEEEAVRYNDIIEIDKIDKYGHLTYKALTTIRFSMDICPSSFVLKIDEDAVFHIDRFFEHIGPVFNPNETAIYCHVWKHAIPNRKRGHPWYISEEQYPGTVFPDFCSGASYLMTHYAIQALTDHTNTTALSQVDDVLLTGLIAEKAHVRRVHLPDMFSWQRRVPLYCNTTVLGKRSLISKHHYKTADEIRSGFEWMKPDCKHLPYPSIGERISWAFRDVLMSIGLDVSPYK